MMYSFSDLSHEKEYIIKQVSRSFSSFGFGQKAVVPVMAVVKLQALVRRRIARKEVERLRQERRKGVKTALTGRSSCSPSPRSSFETVKITFNKTNSSSSSKTISMVSTNHSRNG